MSVIDPTQPATTSPPAIPLSPDRAVRTLAVEVRGATKQYSSEAGIVTVLDALDLEVAQGEAVAIKGVSGSGKSTLLHVLGAIEAPSSGRVKVCGQELSGMKPAQQTRFRAQNIGFVFQFFHLIPTLTAVENVVSGLEPMGGTRAGRQAAARDALSTVGLLGHEDKYPSQLSGGQQQRVAIARAIAKRPAVLLADEPTGALDEANALQVMKLIASLRSEYGCAVVIATHDPLVTRHVDRVLKIEQGRLTAEPSPT